MVCVRWPEHEKTFSASFENFWEKALFTDVTLAVADGCAPAHRAVLAAHSPTLRKLLLQTAEPAPLVFLRGVSEHQLRQLLQLLYTGSVRANSSCISELRGLCRDLQIDLDQRDFICYEELEPSQAGEPQTSADSSAITSETASKTNSMCAVEESGPVLTGAEKYSQLPSPASSAAEQWLSSVSGNILQTPEQPPHYLKESMISIQAPDSGISRCASKLVLPPLRTEPECTDACGGRATERAGLSSRLTPMRAGDCRKAEVESGGEDLSSPHPQVESGLYHSLSALLSALRYDELRSLHQQACDILFPDFTSWLPDEIILVVLSLLGPRDLVRASGCCRRWRALAAEDSVWRRCCQLTCTGGATSDLASLEAGTDGVNFRELCMQWIAWTEQPMPRPRVLKGHNSVIRCMAVDGDRVVTGSSDKTVAVWSTSIGRLERILCCHSEVTSVQVSGELVVAASRNHCLTVWDAITGQQLHTLTGHDGIVWSVALNGTRAASGSDDKTVRLWEVVTGEPLQVLRQHDTVVRAVCFDGRYVVSGDDAGCVRVWNAESGAEEEAWQAASRYVMVLQHACGMVVSGHGDGAINIWDMSTRRLVHEVRDAGGWVTDLSIRQGRMLSGCKDGSAVLWDLSSGDRVRLSGEQGHRQRVTAVRLLSGMAVTASRDGHVKLWHGRHGTFLRSLVTPELSQGPVKQLWASSQQLICGVQNNASDRPHLLLFDMRLRNG